MMRSLPFGSLSAGLPEALPEETFETLICSKHFRLERILSKGHVSPQGFWYEPETDEWVALIQGEAELEIEGDDQPLRLHPGDWVCLPRGRRHRVSYTAPDEISVWLALHGDFDPMPSPSEGEG